MHSANENGFSPAFLLSSHWADLCPVARVYFKSIALVIPAASRTLRLSRQSSQSGRSPLFRPLLRNSSCNSSCSTSPTSINLHTLHSSTSNPSYYPSMTHLSSPLKHGTVNKAPSNEQTPHQPESSKNANILHEKSLKNFKNMGQQSKASTA